MGIDRTGLDFREKDKITRIEFSCRKMSQVFKRPELSNELSEKDPFTEPSSLFHTPDTSLTN